MCGWFDDEEFGAGEVTNVDGGNDGESTIIENGRDGEGTALEEAVVDTTLGDELLIVEASPVELREPCVLFSLNTEGFDFAEDDGFSS